MPHQALCQALVRPCRGEEGQHHPFTSLPNELLRDRILADRAWACTNPHELRGLAAVFPVLYGHPILRPPAEWGSMAYCRWAFDHADWELLAWARANRCEWDEGVNSTVTQLTVPSGVTHIGDDAFANAHSLIYVALPATLTSIGNKAFYHCDSLTSMTLPSGVTRIGDYAFAECGLLPYLALPAALIYIGDCAFYFCSNLASAAMPAQLTHIGDCAFMLCTALSFVRLPTTLIHIGERAFSCCFLLTFIQVPTSIAYRVPLDAFQDCTGTPQLI